MRKKSYDRMLKKVHEINLSVLSTDVRILKLKPLEEQPNYNKLMHEWFGPMEWNIVAETKGIIDAFKESEDWKEIGTLSAHDYKLQINDNLNLILDEISHYQVERVSDGKRYEIIFYREFIGEVHIGIRPVMTNGQL